MSNRHIGLVRYIPAKVVGNRIRDRRRGVPALSFFYEVRYAVGLYDHAMRGGIAKSVADRIAIGQEAIG